MKRIVLPDELKSSDPLAFLCRADEQGLLIGPDETFEAFCSRLERLFRELPKNLPAGLPEASDSVRENAAEITHELYGFRTDWLPAYYSTQETGHFSAGVSLIADNVLPLVCLSGAFLKKKKHCGYTAEETLAHECVHAARIAFPDKSDYDEYFPCQVHKSKFRQLAGNLFRRWQIPAIFFIGLTISVLNPFLLVFPLLVLLAEIRLHWQIRSAAKKIHSLGL
ncbi:MAG: hypothetical protein J5858_01275, partial [Lentisphaeria bacterium]|nr:hypothetical protein [Lentisphaeria bacterium]